jgi:hypothetical protein
MLENTEFVLKDYLIAEGINPSLVSDTDTSILEGLQRLLSKKSQDYIEEKNTGLCEVLYRHADITQNTAELIYNLMTKLVDEARLEVYFGKSTVKVHLLENGFWWDSGEVAPRMEFVKKIINHIIQNYK